MTARQPVRGDVAVLLAAGGLGTRLGPGEPKALRELSGASLLVHAVRRVCLARGVGCVVVATPVDRVDEVIATLRDEVGRGESGPEIVVRVVAGGSTRAASVRAALAATPAAYQLILVHDAARAFAPPELVERVAAAVREGHGAVVPVLPIVDTIKNVDEWGFVLGTADRSSLRAVQTPQGFTRATIEAAHRAAADDLTDDAGLVEKIGVAVYCVPGAPAAMKITGPDDLILAQALAGGASAHHPDSS